LQGAGQVNTASLWHSAVAGEHKAFFCHFFAPGADLLQHVARVDAAFAQHFDLAGKATAHQGEEGFGFFGGVDPRHGLGDEQGVVALLKAHVFGALDDAGQIAGQYKTGPQGLQELAGKFVGKRGVVEGKTTIMEQLNLQYAEIYPISAANAIDPKLVVADATIAAGGIFSLIKFNLDVDSVYADLVNAISYNFTGFIEGDNQTNEAVHQKINYLWRQATNVNNDGSGPSRRGDKQWPITAFSGDAITIKAYLKNYKASQYRIEVGEETLSIADYNAERELRVEYLTAVGQFLSQAGQMVTSYPAAMPYMLKMIGWVTTAVRGSSDIESVLDEAMQAAHGAPPAGGEQKPDHAVEVATINAKVAQGEAQMKAQTEQQKAMAQIQSNERIAMAEIASKEKIALQNNQTKVLVEDMKTGQADKELAQEAIGMALEQERIDTELAHDAEQGEQQRQAAQQLQDSKPAPKIGGE